MPKTNVDRVKADYRRFTDFVRGELKRQKLRQRDLAMYLKVDDSTLSKKLNGGLGWSLMDALTTMEYLNVNIKEIL